MSHFYTDEPHAQIVLSLLKEHNIRKIVVSPGATNIPIAASVQNDTFFEVYSCVDERSAAYLACGLAEESNEIVALSCTGATASRNYMPGLTEAYYRKLPVLAITSFNGSKVIGQLVPQNLDRSKAPNDVVKLSVELPVVKDATDAKYCNYLVNKAILETMRHGGGPVHINLTTTYLGTFNTKKLPMERVIRRFNYESELPDLAGKKIAIFVGAHRRFSDVEQNAIDIFCEKRNSVVLCDHTSSYKGKYRVLSALITSNVTRVNDNWSLIKPDVVLHIGEVSGDYPSTRILEEKSEVWRISEDGEVRDRGGHLQYVYEGSERSFFEKLGPGSEKNTYLDVWKRLDKELRECIPELPFSNTWIAKQLSAVIPENSYLHLGILNSLRNWNLFEVPSSLVVSSNVGGFGIDGCTSTLVGASLTNRSKLYFGVIGDLAFFYDINVIANRHIGNNLRIVIINNGCGAEFNISSHVGSQFGEQSNELIAAGGHFGSGKNDSGAILPSKERLEKSLVKAWADNLGFEYMSAIDKESFSKNAEKFCKTDISKSIIFECFTDSSLESDALDYMSKLKMSSKEKIVVKAKEILPKEVASVAKVIAKKILM